MIAIGLEDRWHLQLAQRWIVQYNFYINHQRWGRIYRGNLPLSALLSTSLSQSAPLVGRPSAHRKHDFRQCSNAFLKCSHPQKLQELADSLTAYDLLSCGQQWLACLTPFLRKRTQRSGLSASAFLSQVEYCDNLIFHWRADSINSARDCWMLTARSASPTRSL